MTGVDGAYDVTVSGGDLADLNGTVTLGFASDQDIEDTAGTALSDTAPTGTNENTYAGGQHGASGNVDRAPGSGDVADEGGQPDLAGDV